ncbi:MAG TPA: hypothetical protein VFP59_10760 [Candidatus Angelobacter sp.]|nr:hypothetical protein [Candidatus Angelobacter sp.]
MGPQYIGFEKLRIPKTAIHGKCLFETPWSRFDHCVIARGGVIAGPLVLGHTRFEAINTFVRAQIFRVVIPSERDGANATDHERGTPRMFVPRIE